MGVERKLRPYARLSPLIVPTRYTQSSTTPMRILTRYILGEVLSHALLGGVLFTFILLMPYLAGILELVVRDSASPADTARLFLYLIPNTLTVTVPMAVLVGILLGLSRLAADSEITAMRAAGMGALSFVRIVSLVSAAALLLGLANSLYVAPRAATALLKLQDSLKNSQASFEIQPRVFYEDLKNYVLFIQDVRPAAGAALWHHVFLADLSVPAAPAITTANSAVVVTTPSDTAGQAQTLTLHLLNGGQHQTSPTDPNQYNISTFTSTDIPIELGAQDETHITRNDTPILALPLHELWRRGQMAELLPAPPGKAQPGNIYRIEFNRRISYPCACFVLMLVGVPLGLSSRRGGKSTGFVLTLALVFLYYFLSSIGVALAKNGKLSPFFGVWGANLIFTAAGAFLLYQLSRGGIALSVFDQLSDSFKRHFSRLAQDADASGNEPAHHRLPTVATTLRRLRDLFGIRFPLLLDDYVLREFSRNLVLVLFSFATLFVIFTFFELIGDIIRNRTPLITVGDYLLNLVPYILYNTTPLCALVAVLITFGALNRSSELTAMKATGISLYRVVIPVLVLSGVIAASLFTFDELYLPQANRRQEALRAEIKGKPAQTFLRPDRKWISGSAPHAGEPARIFYYQFFDPDANVFANLTVFELNPSTFTLSRRIFAASAHYDEHTEEWVLENGWRRTFSGEATFAPFTRDAFPEIREQPSYFKKEDRPSQEMSYHELSRYITDLSQSGFDTMRLRVQLSRKIAYPLVTLVMAMLGIPFALSMGKRGSLAGIALAIALAIAYQVVAGTFEAMGNVNTLPALLAAWSPDILFGLTGAYLLMRTPT